MEVRYLRAFPKRLAQFRHRYNQTLHLGCALLKIWGVLGVLLQGLEAHPKVASRFPRRDVAAPEACERLL